MVGTVEQFGIQFLQLLHHDLVDLQMTAQATALLVHHPDQVAIPVGHLLLLFIGIVKPVDILPSDPTQRAVVGPQQIFHLPHIQQVLRNILLP